ncbi:MAG: carbohydrate ABC transporter substrate-binding protein [Blautia sp.]|nr:carbohydrate ABC transporter substrate-binding protein [Blautia sp.]
MKKKVISGLLVASMLAGMTIAAAPVMAEDAEGSVLNIYCWNEEFKSRLTDHYPGYEEVDATTGKIGDVTVNWNITPNQDNAYQNNLDENLLKQADAAADDKIDLFLVEADYALKYVDTEFTAPVTDLGLTEDELADQYQYTKDIVTDGNGVLKGVSWQGCPGVLIYNRAAATEVFGSDDPATVQEKVKDWDTFKATAAELKEAGYQVAASANDMFRVFSDNSSSKLVEDGKIVVSPEIQQWIDLSKELVDAGEVGTFDLWSDDWNKGFYPDGKVFAYFGPAWLIDFCMAADTEGSIAHDGGWAATEGPQGFSWGGTWICGAAGTDNPTLVADIMRQLTTNPEIMKDIVTADNDFVNNKTVMEEMAADESYGDAVLGGQNALAMFCAGADKIDRSTMSSYDQGYTEELQKAMKDYFEGNATYEDALQMFYDNLMVKYPELTVAE